MCILEDIDDDPTQVSEGEGEVELPTASALLQFSSMGFTLSKEL